jgi:hypothetical protein
MKDGAGAFPVEHRWARQPGSAAVLMARPQPRQGVPTVRQGLVHHAFWETPSLAIDAKDNRRRLFGLEAYPKQWTVLDVRSTGLLEFQSAYKEGEVTRSLNLRGKTPMAENRWTHVAVVVNRARSGRPFTSTGKSSRRPSSHPGTRPLA